VTSCTRATRRPARFLIPATTAVVTVTARVGIATGAIPDGDGVIHGCNTQQIESEDRNNPTLLVGLSGLPAGDYVVWATIARGDGDPIGCDLFGPASEVMPAPDGFVYPVQVNNNTTNTVTITGVLKDAPANTVLLVECTDIQPGAFPAHPEATGDIEALPMSTLH
jgi:hypothetical protein